MALDVWKEVSGVESMLATLLVPKWPLSDCTILAIICVPGRPDPPRRYTLTFCDPLLPTPSNYHIARPRGGLYVYSTNLLLRPIIRPLQSPSVAVYCRRLRLRGILKSQYRLSKSSDWFA
ncbi:hypothetical protein TNCV_5077551 [Trichonephila clavipes]|uniref:Uncharacterized protein n=1 Tax=Trichonephila clavipes TaxID=2585209 RepID=A0A8X6RY24_TRICX|nr:hypothetical protein TNCV_5077551 [Trichonephila clavipes]